MLGLWIFLEKSDLMQSLKKLLEGLGKYSINRILMYDDNAYPNSTFQISIIVVKKIQYGTYMSSHINFCSKNSTKSSQNMMLQLCEFFFSH
jgi:hypothetical protein